MREAKLDIVSYYDRFAAEDAYDEVSKGYNANSGMVYEAVNCFRPPRKGQKLLDVGCGTGLASAPFAQNELEIHGIDGSPCMLRLFFAKGFASGAKQMNLISDDFPYAASYFDLVISNGVFCLFESLDRLISEAGRVLRPGGLFCFTVEDVRSNRRRITRSNMDVFCHKLDYLQPALAKNGFSIVADPATHNAYQHSDQLIVRFTVVLAEKGSN